MKDIKKFFAGNYSKCWKFVNECRWFFVATFGIFILTFLIGFTYPVFFRNEIFEMLKMLALEIKELSTLGMVGFIFLNNLKASFFAMLLGIGIGIFPLIVCIVNGYLLGFVAREAVMIDGIWTLWRIFPHGIFELPAIIFSIGIGLRIGVSVIKGKWLDDKGDVGYLVREGLRFFAFVILPLLIVAGIIEGILIGTGA